MRLSVGHAEKMNQQTLEQRLFGYADRAIERFASCANPLPPPLPAMPRGDDEP